MNPFADWLTGNNLNDMDESLTAPAMTSMPRSMLRLSAPGQAQSSLNRDTPNQRGGSGLKQGQQQGGGKGGKGFVPMKMDPLALPKLPGGYHAPNTGAISTSPGDLGFGSTLGATYSPKDEYESTTFKKNPEAGFAAHLGSIGLQVGGGDNYGQWLQRQYQQAYADWDALRTDERNQNLTFQDFMHSLGGTTPEAQQAYWRQKYLLDTQENRGENVTPYAGMSRWLTNG